MKTQQHFGNLSEFKTRGVELFRSSDLNSTALYFTLVDDEARKEASACFELLRFELNGGTDHFVEIYEAGIGSSHGTMMKAIGKNVFEPKHASPIKIYSHDNDLLLVMGADSGLQRFNFMKRVAEYNKGNPFDSCPQESSVNYEQIEAALSFKYLKIPDSIRAIQFCYRTKEISPKYILVDHPAYMHEPYRFFVIENIFVQYEIKSFRVFRDGGTTIIGVIDEAKIQHNLYVPSPLSQDKTLHPKWDEMELIEATGEEKQNLIDLLGIQLETMPRIQTKENAALRKRGATE